MNCATFRDTHSLLLDDLLDDAGVVAMECHLVECAECAALYARVRRAQLLFRNASPIAPSADFAERLHARLSAERRAAARANAAPPRVAARGPGLGMFAAAAAGVAAAGYLATATLASPGARRELSLPPVVASRTADAPSELVADASPSPVSSPAIMASVSAGMPLWPSALLVEQAPLHFAAAEFQLTSYGQ